MKPAAAGICSVFLCNQHRCRYVKIEDRTQHEDRRKTLS